MLFMCVKCFRKKKIKKSKITPDNLIHYITALVEILTSLNLDEISSPMLSENNVKKELR